MDVHNNTKKSHLKCFKPLKMAIDKMAMQAYLTW